MVTQQHWATRATERVLPKKVAALGPLFAFTVILPVLCAIIYFGFIASDVYISEARYVVRAQGKGAPSGLASLLVGSDLGGLAGGGEAASAADYIASRDAVKALNVKGELTKAFSHSDIDIFDRLGVFGRRVTEEDMFKYFSNHVTVDQDSHSGITALYVRAYRPEEAQRINEQLLVMAEGLVNRLNQRSREDLVRYARSEVEHAQKEAERARLAMARFRIKYGVVDPEKQAEVSLEMISKLQDQIIISKTQLSQVRGLTPQNPQIPGLEDRIRTLETEMERETQKLVGNRSSLASKTAEYTKLALESEFTEKYLTTALAAMQTASNDARRQQAYVQRIVQPNLPDKPLEPRRLRNVFAVLVLGLVAWGVLSLLFSAMREHSL